MSNYMREIERVEREADKETLKGIKQPVAIIQRGSSGETTMNAPVTYNHYEIHIHIPESATTEQIKEVMTNLQKPQEDIREQQAEPKKKGRWGYWN